MAQLGQVREVILQMCGRAAGGARVGSARTPRVSDYHSIPYDDRPTGTGDRNVSARGGSRGPAQSIAKAIELPSSVRRDRRVNVAAGKRRWKTTAELSGYRVAGRTGPGGEA